MAIKISVSMPSQKTQMAIWISDLMPLQKIPPEKNFYFEKLISQLILTLEDEYMDNDLWKMISKIFLPNLHFPSKDPLKIHIYYEINLVDSDSIAIKW